MGRYLCQQPAVGHRPPQPAFLALAEAGAIHGRVLDVGCGTGEHALMCAALGLDATGVDLSGVALHAA
jgi:SAM-dependent methyltransferase